MADRPRSIEFAMTAGLLFVASFPAPCKPTFIASELQAPASEILFCDLDGDRLKDAVLPAGTNLTIVFQDAKLGFAGSASNLLLQNHLGQAPALLCAARLLPDYESLLAMTADGVTEFYFTNRTSQPGSRQIVAQKTAIPQHLQGSQHLCFPFTADSRTGSPLLLLPAGDGLQIWTRRGANKAGTETNEWARVQTLKHALHSHVRPFTGTNPGYSHALDFDLCISDMNGDGREDLMVRQQEPDGRERFSAFLQTSEGLFTPESVLSYTNKPDWHNSLSWVDLNHDGKIDLIKSTFLDEAFFVPGMRSGKVMVGTYVADAAGRIPAEPQQVFRKYDWSTALPMVDVDGDGYVDMALGYIPINAREGFRKAVTAEQIDFTLKVHFYRPGSGYLNDPDCRRDVLLQFHNEFFFTQERRLYYEQLLSLNGDFNGDGKKDLLVKDEKKSISIYFFISREKGFNSEPDLKLDCPEPIDAWEVQDLNGDGISDLIVKLREGDRYRIFISQTNKQKAGDGK